MPQGKINNWKVHLLANLLAPGLALALGPVPAHLLLQEQYVLRCQKQTVANLTIVPDDWLVAVDVETLLGRVLDVTKWIVGVGGGSVPVCAVFFIFKDWQGKGVSSLSKENFHLKK